MYTRKSNSSVNDLLHKLRGEQFRHQQNVNRSKTHLTFARAHNLPSLPFSLIEIDGGDRTEGTILSNSSEIGTKPPAGPVPKSWISTRSQIVPPDRRTPSWRKTALSLMIKSRSNSNVPSLVDYCICILLHAFHEPGEFADDLVPLLPPHLRRELLYYTAIHEPLSNQKLYALLDPLGHADGEIIVVGPQESLRNDIFPSRNFNRDVVTERAFDEGRIEVDISWDADNQSDDWLPNTQLHKLMLVSTTIHIQTYLNFPPTLTHLGLIDIAPLPIHRLPGLCPLLVVLDLSYNRWLTQISSDESRDETALGRVDWRKWNHLQILGLRQCNIEQIVLHNINRERWVDLKIIQ